MNRIILLFTLLWTILTPLALAAGILFWQHPQDHKTALVLILCTCAAAVTAPIALLLERYICAHSSMSARFACIISLLGVGTLGASALAHSLYLYQSHFHQWMDGPYSFWGVMNIIGYTIATTYTFSTVVPRLFLPFGLIALLVAGLFHVYQCKKHS